MYKTGMAIPEGMIATAMFYCCSEDLRGDILRDTQNDLSTMSESDITDTIKRLAVKQESTLVHRIRLGKMTQSPGTSIRTYLASLRGQAALCQYVKKCTVTDCTHTFDFSDEEIESMMREWNYALEIVEDTYNSLLEKGLAREQARAILPVGTYTEFYWTVNLRSLFNFISLRTADDAQAEMQQYANAIHFIAEEKAAWCFEAYEGNKSEP